MNESTKSRPRRLSEGFFERCVSGAVIDIGCGDDPVVPDAFRWDLPQGDAQLLATIADESFDTVYASHCLEHMRDPHEALFNWWRVLRPEGHLIFAVPDEDLYEQGLMPSVFNPDHKWTFAISKERSWSPRSLNVTTLLGRLPGRKVLCIRTIDCGYDYSRLGAEVLVDQTAGEAEAAIEAVVQKGPRLLQLRSALKSLATCPTCGRMALTLIGVSMANVQEVRCEHCGTGATL
jgi:SAM-dependent methyltransferase